MGLCLCSSLALWSENEERVKNKNAWCLWWADKCVDMLFFEENERINIIYLVLCVYLYPCVWVLIFYFDFCGVYYKYELLEQLEKEGVTVDLKSEISDHFGVFMKRKMQLPNKEKK